jgi:hypothetical protein
MIYELPVVVAEIAIDQMDLVRVMHALHIQSQLQQCYIVIKRHGWRDIQVIVIARRTHISSTVEGLISI